MFDSLLGRKFSNKCKHSVKCIMCRMETIRKKKHAMVKYLKKDVADLVSRGHDTNAFGRMDDLLSEINLASCYDMIEQYCCCILEHLPTMKKEREYSEETVEAVATLIFAAARFSDLPELADLRRVFTERYGTNMESYTNTEFVEKMQHKSFSQDKKLQLMKDITQEFMVDWDIKSFKYKISNPPSPIIDHPKIQFLSNSITDGRREVTDGRNVVNGRKIILKIAEEATYLASDAQKQQIEFAKVKTVVINNEDQKIIADESENIELHHFMEGFIHSTAEEVVKKTGHNGAVNTESKRASNLKPPYVKPNVKSPLETSYVKPTNFEMCRDGDNGDDHKNAPFSVRKRRPEQGTGRRMYRTYSDQPRHGSSSFTATYDGGCDEVEVTMDKFLPHSGKDRILERHVEDTEQYSKLSIRRNMRSVSMQPDVRSPNGGRVHPKLPDYDDLAARFAALRK